MSVPSSEQAISHVHSGPFRGTSLLQPVPDAGTQSIEDPTLVPTALLGLQESSLGTATVAVICLVLRQGFLFF